MPADEQELIASKQALERKTEELTEANRRLRESEQRYRTALAAVVTLRIRSLRENRRP